MAPIDRDSISARLDLIQEQVEVLRGLERQGALDTTLADPLGFNGVVRMLQTSVEAMIDIAYHLCAKKLSKAPESAMDAFELLAGRNLIPRAFLDQAKPMVRFRNKVVHGYLEQDRGIIRGIVLNNLGSFDQLEKIVFGILSTEEIPAEQPTTSD